MRRKQFCEISPLTYAIALRKEIVKRHFKNMLSRVRYASHRQDALLPVEVSRHSCHLIKTGPGIDPQLQRNKAHNIALACSKINGLVINPGEAFSFWKCVGKTSERNGFAAGRVIEAGRVVAGVGGGLCNLANTINLLVMHSPLTITEVHHHSDALSPDPDGVRVPYSAGTSVNYNFVDYRFANNTDRPVQLCVWCEDDTLQARLLTTKEFPTTYRLVEEGHHFALEDNGNYYRISKIYRETIDRSTGKPVSRDLMWDNHSKVLFDHNLIPRDQIK